MMRARIVPVAVANRPAVSRPKTQAAYYPVFLDLRGRRVVVVGGGLIAQRKVAALLRAGAEVEVVSPDMTRRLAQAAADGVIRHVARRFQFGDVRGVWLICAATDDQVVNTRVYQAACKARVFANIVDQKSLCSFLAPSIARRGQLTVAVSTGGASPTMAKHVRRELERVLGPEYGRLLRLMAGLRDAAKRRLPTYAARRRYFEELIGGRVGQLAQRGRSQAARRGALALMDQYAQKSQRCSGLRAPSRINHTGEAVPRALARGTQGSALPPRAHSPEPRACRVPS